MAKLPLVRALRSALPQTRIIWIAKVRSLYEGTLRPLTEGMIDEFLYIPSQNGHWGDLFNGPLFDGRRFDVLLDAQKKVKRSFWLKYKIRHSVFLTDAFGGLHSDLRSPNRTRSTKMLDQLLDLASLAAGQKLVAQPLDLPALPLYPKWENAARELLPDGPRYVGFIVGASQIKKRWPLDRFVALAKRWAERGETPVFILGPSERDLEGELRACAPEALFPLSSPLFTDPLMTLALARRLAITVANDSGGAHLASSAGQKMVWLFRKASVRDKYAPSSLKTTALAPEDFGGTGLEGIPLEEVDAAMNALLAAQDR